APASGVINCSRFLMRCSAARRAERGPRPGSRASSWIRRSISGPATATGMMDGLELHPRRQRQPAGERLHLFLQQGLTLAARVRRNDEILDDLSLVRLDQ